MKVLTTAWLAALAVATLSACGGDTVDDPGPTDVTPGFWDPGQKPATSCAGYGSGGAYGGEYGGATCSDVVVVCTEQPCVRGQCVTDVETGDACQCDAGYAGTLCDACAPGFVADGLVCVRASDACAEAPCVFGTCIADGPDFTCDCDAGYQGDVCDSCAPGYHADGLSCAAG